MRSPVLFVVFSRLDTASQVFEAIRQARPPRLYMAADGPRPDRPGEAERCAAVRALADQVDWPCEVHTLFREENLGCKLGPKTAIDWFFQHEPEGIVLEDDCLPAQSFFTFCDEMLERYRDDPRVMSVSGDNYLEGIWQAPESYYFSRYNYTWGWASWRRAWAHYDERMSDWNEVGEALLKKVFAGEWYNRRCWRDLLERTFDGRLSTVWDYQFLYASWKLGAYGCIPAANLVKNIGFGSDATHTACDQNWLARMTLSELDFPLRHPKEVAPAREADRLYELRLREGGFLAAIWRKVRRLLPI